MHQGNCTFGTLTLSSARSLTDVRRLSVAALPEVVEVGGAGGPSVTLGLPSQLAVLLGDLSSDASVDLAVSVAPAGGSLVTDIVSVEFRESSSGLQIPIQGLTETITIMFAADPGAAALRTPMEDWYECVYEDEDEDAWRTDGTWLATGAPASGLLGCHTTHLTSFAVQAKVNVESIRGCPMDVPPAALQCPPTGLALTITGGNFGLNGASASLRARSSGQVLAPSSYQAPPLPELSTEPS